MSQRRRLPRALLAILSLILTAACVVDPAPASDDTPLYLIVDPARGTVEQAGLSPQRLLHPGSELGLAGLSFSFEPGNLFVIDASFRNTSSDLKYRDIRFIPRGRGYVESREPTLENEQLGADGFLTPDETTPTLRFEIVHRSRPFIYYVLVDADVVEIRTDFGDLEALAGGPLLDPDEGNCAVNELVTREQGYRLAGGVGGLSLDDPAGPFDPTPTVVAADLAAQIASVLGETTLDRDVALLVVDDFGTPDLDPGLFDLAANDLDPALAPFDALDLLLDELIEEGVLAHGPLVMAHAMALLSALPGVDYEGPVENVHLFGRDGHAIALVAIDTQGFRTDAIAASIFQGLEQLAATLPTLEFGQIVVNMSFNVIPCTVLADFNASGAASLDAYLELLAAANDLVGLEAELAAFTTTAVLPDPLEEVTGLDLPGASGPAIFVGSAGNFGNAFVNDFTLAPALWPRVIGVASLDGTGVQPSVFTNPGEVAFGGAWIVLEDGVGSVYTENGGRAPATRLAGTSFAAPAVSLFSALDLASAARCAPPDDATPPRLATGAVGYGENALAEAVASSCLP